MPILETERLVLRAFAQSDWDTVNAIVSDPAVTRYMHFASWDEGKRRNWFAWMIQEAANPRRVRFNWAIVLRTSGLLIGWLFIGGDRDGTEQGTPGCGYALDRTLWGQGYMSEALRAAFTYEFTVLGTQEIIAECEPENIASARVMQKSGMTYVGTYYDADFEGNWAERHHYKITAQGAAQCSARHLHWKR
jgi:RimJ/RimL family protein N-acetyltransferase